MTSSFNTVRWTSLCPNPSSSSCFRKRTDDRIPPSAPGFHPAFSRICFHSFACERCKASSTLGGDDTYGTPFLMRLRRRKCKLTVHDWKDGVGRGQVGRLCPASVGIHQQAGEASVFRIHSACFYLGIAEKSRTRATRDSPFKGRPGGKRHSRKLQLIAIGHKNAAASWYKSDLHTSFPCVEM